MPDRNSFILIISLQNIERRTTPRHWKAVSTCSNAPAFAFKCDPDTCVHDAMTVVLKIPTENVPCPLSDNRTSVHNIRRYRKWRMSCFSESVEYYFLHKPHTVPIFLIPID
ncbi:hypothetical protein TNCV_2110081 [Trichonephila clavipes]|nr:hypothetical protein TNCV_2110081 [Trichonephila clavipes]